MRVKIYKRGTVVRNMMIFIMLSVLYVHVVRSLDRNISAFQFVSFFNTFGISLIFFFALAFILPAVALVKPSSKMLVTLFFGGIVIYGQIQFFSRFDKGILVLNLLYLLAVFYFYILWHLELRLAVYTPMYSTNNIGLKSPYDLKATVEFSDVHRTGYLTNWDPNGCFIILDERVGLDDIRTGPLTLKFELEGKTFEQSGEVISEYEKGAFGIKFGETKTNEKRRYGWKDFYTIICDRGYLPGYLKA